MNKPPPGALYTVELLRTSLEFNALTAALANYSCRLAGRQETLPKSDEQAPEPQTFQQIIRRIHEELGRPQQSSREKRRAQDAANAAASWLVPLPRKDGNETEGK